MRVGIERIDVIPDVILDESQRSGTENVYVCGVYTNFTNTSVRITMLLKVISRPSIHRYTDRVSVVSVGIARISTTPRSISYLGASMYRPIVSVIYR